MNFLESIEAMKQGHVVERDDEEVKLKIKENIIYSMLFNEKEWQVMGINEDDLTSEWNIVIGKFCPHCGKELEED